MAQNDIQLWVSNIGSTIESLNDYIADVRRTGGLRRNSDLIEAAILNRLFHQTSLMSAALAQFIANRYPPGVLDTSGITGAAEVDAIEIGLMAAIKSVVPAATAATATANGTAGIVALAADNVANTDRTRACEHYLI